ncbi:RDD family protein [Fusibacter tunisiensis]|uniref:RDD family membrane protein YckC n=1 Tax=Fusibacter tunisiensis TaxID=1008308 RepID=A0ABS2MS23_9FIRM|nr:RDD family protein [Fusibacter tunisiensis]MBM7562152.1 putative RDD family membrane protein YckC [Fusibacter tunisiensis]
MLTENNLTWKMRLRELFIDYICILIYLIILFGITMGIYLVVLKGIPEFNELQSQLVALLTSVIPIVLIFSFWDYSKGSIGKRKAGLELYYANKTFGASLVRNIIKFLPWQLGHIGTIRGIYTNFDTVAIIFTICSMVLAIVLLVMGLVRRDKRHLGDLIAGTQTQVR